MRARVTDSFTMHENIFTWHGVQKTHARTRAHSWRKEYLQMKLVCVFCLIGGPANKAKVLLTTPSVNDFAIMVLNPLLRFKN